jgi:hypothetical protein
MQPRGNHSRVLTSVASATIAVGTSRTTDLVAAFETLVGQNLDGVLITNLQLYGVARPLVTGASNYAVGVQRASNLLDVADLDAANQAGDAWMWRRDHFTYGQRHLVATTPTLEFDEIHWRARIPAVRVRTGNDALWLVESTTLQNWEAFWMAQGTVHL